MSKSKYEMAKVSDVLAAASPKLGKTIEFVFTDKNVVFFPADGSSGVLDPDEAMSLKMGMFGVMPRKAA